MHYSEQENLENYIHRLIHQWEQAGGAVVTGKACVEILYRTFSDTAMPERFSCILPFTQTVECAGAGAHELRKSCT